MTKLDRANLQSIFNVAIEKAKLANDPHKVARLELAREYVTNPDFASKLADYVWSINCGKPR